MRAILLSIFVVFTAGLTSVSVSGCASKPGAGIDGGGGGSD